MDENFVSLFKNISQDGLKDARTKSEGLFYEHFYKETIV